MYLREKARNTIFIFCPLFISCSHWAWRHQVMNPVLKFHSWIVSLYTVSVGNLPLYIAYITNLENGSPLFRWTIVKKIWVNMVSVFMECNNYIGNNFYILLYKFIYSSLNKHVCSKWFTIFLKPMPCYKHNHTTNPLKSTLCNEELMSGLIMTMCVGVPLLTWAPFHTSLMPGEGKMHSKVHWPPFSNSKY